MSAMREVALHPAFSFTCEDCGRISYTSAVPVEDPELQAESQAHFKEILETAGGTEMAEMWEGELVMAPLEVTCPYCNTAYKVLSQQYELGGLDMLFDDDEFDDDLDDEEFDEDLDDEFDDEFDDDDDEDWDFDEDDFDKEMESQG